MIKKLTKLVLPSKIAEPLRAELRKETHINRALRASSGKTYVEIGVAAGKCFRLINAPCKIAVDPAPKGDWDSLAAGESLYRMTSDEFFTGHAEEVLGHEKVDVAFIDGLHEFPQALRDAVNLEKFMSKQGIIFMHDCNPPTREHTEMRRGESTGDVWKCAYYFSNYRPDLHFFTLDCDWGLGVLTGFDSSSGDQSPDSKIIDMCNSLDYSLLEKERKSILRLRPFWYSLLYFTLVFPKSL